MKLIHSRRNGKGLLTDFYKAWRSFENLYPNDMCGSLHTTDFYSHMLWKKCILINSTILIFESYIKSIIC